jgi:hypothetical protein
MTEESDETNELPLAASEAADEQVPLDASKMTPARKSQRATITGAVADIEDRYTLIINQGENAGVKTGMIFAVLGDDGSHVIDPTTGEDLGARPVVKLRVKVTDVFEKFARAETYVIVSPLQSLGLGPRGDLGQTMQDMFDARELALGGSGRQRLAGYGRPKGNEEPAPEAVVPVRIGDRVKQVG